jgi:aspartyl-tRNA(Asn)/glutamyl-tRNA(Gln) amidotransferase subunit A
MPDQFWYADAGTLRRLFGSGAASPVEYVRSTLDRVEELNPELGAFITVDREGALAAAGEAEQRIRSQGDAAFRDAPLLGMAVSIKDLIPTRGLRTTRGSLLFQDWVPDFDAPAVERLRRAGAVIIGKTNTSEFGWSGAARNRLVPPTRNPWARELTSGGSSGGAAASVAMGVGVGAVGTDGAGSLRIPAAFCGVVGFKPSFGRVPYVPVSVEGMSHQGPIARSVDDLALLLDVMAGPDARDPLSLPAPNWDLGGVPAGPLRIAWIRSLAGPPHPDPAIEKQAAETVAALGVAGHTVTDLDPGLPDPYLIAETILTTLTAAATADAAADRLDPGLLALVEVGKRTSGVELSRAALRRAEYTERIRVLMNEYDLLAMPTVPVPPFPADRDFPDLAVGKGALEWLTWTPSTFPFNLTGQPAISVPAGFTPAGLPVGLQLVGGWRADDTVIRAARQLESLRPWRDSYAALGEES